MSTLSIRLPDSLHRMAKNIAAEDHVSMNQFIASVVAEKVSALTNETYLKERAQRASADKFKAALAAVPDSEPEDFDRR
jgi:predicted DNA-binding ribbon-helix-helix protein